MNMQNSLPVNLQVKGKQCLVVGAGKAAYHKISTLIQCKAKVTVISPEADPKVEPLLSKTQYFQRTFQADDFKAFFLIIAATDSKQINDQVAQLCREQHILFSRLDSEWRDGDFFRPASFSENSFTVSISTGGRSVRAAQLMKSMLQNEFKVGEHFDCLVAVLPKPVAVDELKDNIILLRGVTDVHSFYTSKFAVITAVTLKSEKLYHTITQWVKHYHEGAEIFTGEDAFFNPLLKNVILPENDSFTKTWISARQTGDVLTYNNFIGKID